MATRFQWGKTDCMLMLAEWVMSQTGCDDPCGDISGLYSDVESCQRVTGYVRAPVDTTQFSSDRAGLAGTIAPKAGDIAVVEVWQPDGPVQCGALCLGDHWMFRSQEAAVIIMETVEVLRAWSVVPAHAR